MTLSYGIGVFRQIDALFNPYMLFSVSYVPMWFDFFFGNLNGLAPVPTF